MTYTITSKDGVEYGQYQGETPAEALLAMHRDAAHEGAVWLDDTGALVFESEEYRALMGDVSDWHIVVDQKEG